MALTADFSLYVILDVAHLRGRDLLQLATDLCRGGASIVQYRAKGEGEPFHREAIPRILEAVHPFEIPLIVNDEIDLAIRYGADGVHLGRGDLPIAEARRREPGLIIGATVHSPEEARDAIAAGADYLGVGSIYPTRTKTDIRLVGLDTLALICGISTIPVIAIGGIDEERVDEILSRGAHGIAVISAVLDEDDPARAARRLRERVDRYLRKNRSRPGPSDHSRL